VLSRDDIAILDARARAVGERVGWEMHFSFAPNPEFIGLTAGANHIFVVGPDRLAYDIDLALDALDRGASRIILDEDGDPRLASAPDEWTTPECHRRSSAGIDKICPRPRP
jgi:hypothetical protein